MATATASRRKTAKKKVPKKAPKKKSSRVKDGRQGQKSLSGMDESDARLDRLVNEHLKNLDEFKDATTAVQGSNQRLMSALEKMPEKRYFSRKFSEGFEIKSTEQKLKKMKKPKVDSDD